MQAIADPPRIGLVGSGLIAGAHLQAWRSLAHVGAVYSLAPDVEQFAARHGWPVAGSLEELAQQVDVIDICAPTPVHAELAMAAAGLGRHVICEKPIARTVADGRRVIDACQEAGVQLHVGHVVRFFPEYAQAKAAVEAGRIGRPAVLRLDRRTARPASPWFSDVEASGGVIVDQMIHDYDYARWIAGDVSAVFAKQVEIGGHTTAAYVVLTHQSGALSHVQGRWGPAGTQFETSFTLSGSTGRLDHSSRLREALQYDVPAHGGSGGLLPADPGRSPFANELEAFSRSLRGGPAPPVTPYDALEALRIALAALRSLEAGRSVRPSEVDR